MALKQELINLLSNALTINESYLEYKIEQHWKYATPYSEKTESRHFKYIIDERYTDSLLIRFEEISDEVYDMGCDKQYLEGAELSMIIVKEVTLILDRINNAYLPVSKKKELRVTCQNLLDRNTQLIEELVVAAKGEKTLSDKVLDWLLNDWCLITMEELHDQNDFTWPANLFENMHRRSETFRQVSSVHNKLSSTQFSSFAVANVKRVFYQRVNDTAKLTDLLENHKFYFNLHVYYILELTDQGFIDEALNYCNNYGAEVESAYKELIALPQEDILKRLLYFTSDEARIFIRWWYEFVYDTLIYSKRYDQAIEFVLGLFHVDRENSSVRFSVSEKVDYYKKLCEDLPMEKRNILSELFFKNADANYSPYDIKAVAEFENNWPAFLQALKKDFSIVTLFRTYEEYKAQLATYPEDLYDAMKQVIINFVDKYAPNKIDKKRRNELIQGLKTLRTILKNDQLVFELVYDFKKSYPHRRVLCSDLDLYLKQEGLRRNYESFVNEL